MYYHIFTYFKKKIVPLFFTLNCLQKTSMVLSLNVDSLIPVNSSFILYFELFTKGFHGIVIDCGQFDNWEL